MNKWFRLPPWDGVKKRAACRSSSAPCARLSTSTHSEAGRHVRARRKDGRSESSSHSPRGRGIAARPWSSPSASRPRGTPARRLRSPRRPIRRRRSRTPPRSRRKYGGQSITFIGDSVGGGHTRDIALAKRFSKDTGIKVKVIPHPTASDASYSQLARAFATKSRSFDVAMIDVVWPGAFAPYLVDLKPKLGAQAKLHAAGIIENNTVDGKLVAMPWFGDFGILYYRTDLLKKYGYRRRRRPGRSSSRWRRRSRTARRQSNHNFSGFVFQGNSYEGLTCDALEWIASVGRRQLHRQRQGHDQQPEGGRDPRPVPQADRQDHAARRDLLPGGRGAHRVPRRQRGLHAQLAVRVLDRSRPEDLEGRRQVQRHGAPARRGRQAPSAPSAAGSSRSTSTPSTSTPRSSSSAT